MRSETLTGEHKTQRTGSFGFDILRRYYEDGDEILDHIERIIGDEIWLSTADYALVTSRLHYNYSLVT
jgi:hypothetical protein